MMHGQTQIGYMCFCVGWRLGGLWRRSNCSLSVDVRTQHWTSRNRPSSRTWSREPRCLKSRNRSEWG